jgi:hypothetical protein
VELFGQRTAACAGEEGCWSSERELPNRVVTRVSILVRVSAEISVGTGFSGGVYTLRH